MKRGRKDTLTGGTGDVNPQFLSRSATQSAADATTTTQIALPVTRIPQSNKVTIVEFLKIFIDYGIVGGTAAADTTYNVGFALSTVSFGTTNARTNEPNVIARSEVIKQKAFTAAGTYQEQRYDPFTIDLTDGAGHGILVATEQIFAQVSSSNTGAVNTIDFKIMYRFKTVDIVEYVGIVQSQQ